MTLWKQNAKVQSKKTQDGKEYKVWFQLALQSKEGTSGHYYYYYYYYASFMKLSF
jgi:hypothetical protein